MILNKRPNSVDKPGMTKMEEWTSVYVETNKKRVKLKK